MKNYSCYKVLLKCLIIVLVQNLNAQILLPVEVIGENFTTASRTFNISNSLQVEELYLLVNNFNAEGKVEIKFNDEAIWTSLTNSNTQSDAQGEAFGAIGGGYSTLKIYVNISGRVNNGVNTIQFRFNNQNDDISSGYRIVEFNILRESGTPMLPDSAFEYDDPSNWAPIYTENSVIREGEDLWNTASLVDSAKEPGITIDAKCASCHAVDGRDLKYFNYSNLSIVERSKFHGLTELEGEKIASYIRSLDVDVPENARPWNPPYQPGPGLDSKPVSEWSAGAGLEWVLESDADMQAYLFPDGITDEALNSVFNIKGTLNIREMPIALQFPDWNRWLPRIHPIDMMTTSDYERLLTGVGGVSGTRPRGTYGYQIVKQHLENNGVASYNDGVGKNLLTILDDLGQGVQDILYRFQTDNSGDFPWTILSSPAINRRTDDDMLVEEYKVNLAKWNAIKHWEIMQEFEIEGIKPLGLDYAEARQWPVNNWTVFAIAPHIVADRRGRSRFEGQAVEMGLYESTAWYQLQMTLNAGMRFPRNVAPVDWSYNFDHVTKSGIATGHREPLRLIQNLIKGYQQRDNTVRANGNDLVNQTAWNMREVSPWRLYSTAQGNTTIHDELDNYETGLRSKLFSKLLKMFMDKADMLDESDWPRSNTGEWHTLETSTYNPSNYSEADCLFPNANGRCTDIQNAIEADAMFTLMPLLQDIGMNCGEVERLRAWSEMMWSRGDWSQFIDADCTALSTDDPTLNNYFTVYPSPSKGILNLSIIDAWTLFDTTGKKIMSGESKEIDITHLPTSMYFLNTSYGVKKIIKN